MALVLTLLALSTYPLVDIFPFKWYVIVSVFLGTFTLYSFHRLYKIDFIPKTQLGERHQWMLRNGRLIKYGMAICVLLALFILPNYDAKDIVWVVPAAIISIGYTVPIIPVESKWWRLRDIPIAKPFIIAFIVAYLTLCFPIFEHFDLEEVFTQRNITLFIERAVFLLSVTIPFEMRDLKSDRDAGLSTVATFLGFSMARRMAYASIGLWLILFLPRSLIQENYPLFFSGILIGAGTALGVYQIDEKRSELFYVIVFEGLIALYALTLITFT